METLSGGGVPERPFSSKKRRMRVKINQKKRYYHYTLQVNF